MEAVILALVSVAIVLLVVLIAKGSPMSTNPDLAEFVRQEAELREALARAEAAKASDAQQLAAFSSASQQALAGQSHQLLQLAETRYGALSQQTNALLGGHTQRVSEALDALGARLASLERERAEATTSLTAMVRELAVANRATRDETAQLRTALRDSRVRGAWGEVQLRRVLELSGLERHVDFVEQSSTATESGSIRPDVVVHLPNGRVVVIDAKAPLDRFLDAAAAQDPDTQQRLLSEHSRAVSAHVSALAARRYSENVDGAVDMVVLFVPGEPFLSAALDADASLFEAAANKGVVLTSPSSLLPLLRGIAVGWRERQAEEQAAEIQRLGAELHERIARFLDSYAAVGAKLNQAAEAYNRSLGSVETRLLVTARKLADHGAGSPRQMPEVSEVLRVARTPTAGTLEPVEWSGEADAPEAFGSIETLGPPSDRAASSGSPNRP